MSTAESQFAKPSRLEWPMNTPAHWRVDRLKWSMAGLISGTWGDEPNGVDDLICVRVADFDRTRFAVVDAPPTLRAIEAKERANRLLRQGDLLIEKSGGGDNQPVGCVVDFDHTFAAVCSNFIGRMPVASGMWPRYWAYVHASLYSGRLNVPAIKQTTGIQNLDTDAYFNQRVPFPRSEDQRAIADYLDRETARLDALVAAKERVLGLLAEKRRALITRAVTRGLDPRAPLRDSGIPWLGAIPANWTFERLKFHLDGIEQGWSPICDSMPASQDEWGVLKAGCVNGWDFDPNENKRLPDDTEPLPQYEVRHGDVLMSRANTTALLGSTALLGDVRPRLLLCDKLYRLGVNDATLCRRYLVAFLRSPVGRYEFERDATGASNSMQNIGQDSVRNLWLPIPPIDEQRAIVDHIVEATVKLEAMRTATERTVRLLKERRAALITAAVTGN